MQDTLVLEEDGSYDVPLTRGRTRRRSLRRAVTLDCQLESDVWDGRVVLPATDISNEGLWVETPYALAEGEEVVVSFELPGGEPIGRVWAIAEVARVGLFRRRGEAQPSGMALAFTYCSEDDRKRLCTALQGLPPPLPSEAYEAYQSSVPPPLPLAQAAGGDDAVEAHGSAREQNRESAKRVEARGSAREQSSDDPLPLVLDWLLASE